MHLEPNDGMTAPIGFKMEDYVHCLHGSNALGGRIGGNLVPVVGSLIMELDVAHCITLMDVGEKVPASLATVGYILDVDVAIEHLEQKRIVGDNASVVILSDSLSLPNGNSAAVIT